MKKHIFIVLCMVLIALNGCSAQYKRISFDEAALGEILDTHISEKTKVIYEENDSFSDKLPLYKISSRNISDKEFKQMLDQLELSEYESSFSLDGNKLTGTLANYTDAHREYFNMSEEELEQLAWDTFNKIPFIEGHYEYLGIRSTDTLSSSTETHITRVGVSFRKNIDDIGIVGNEQCWLYFDGSGLVEINIELYDYKKINTIDLVPLKTASERIKTPDSFSVKSESIGMLDTLQVEQIQLLYVNQYRDDCKVLQPAYNFKGIATDVNGAQSEFNSLIVAVPEKE